MLIKTFGISKSFKDDFHVPALNCLISHFPDQVSRGDIFI